MRCELTWSALALADRDGAFDYIEADNPRAAVAVNDRVSRPVGRLQRFPESGHPGRIEGTRELVIQHTPYALADAYADGAVRVLRLLHGSRQWPDSLPEAP